MPSVDIHIDRPWLTFTLVIAVIAMIARGTGGTTEAQVAGPMGGDEEHTEEPIVVAQQAVDEMVQLRDEQQVLSKREDILRSQLELLEEQINSGDDTDLETYIATRDELTSLLQDKAAAEQKLVSGLHEYWQAEGYAYEASRQSVRGPGQVRFYWPVDPLKGISAHFNDKSYEKRFGMPHQAIDIPAKQGSVVTAVADGIVTNVSNQGMGFNSLVIRHANGYSTLYGHVSKFLVQEGDSVRAGDAVALSGGTPGTRGAGLMTTGAHLHLAMYKDGVAVDPLRYLPETSDAR